MLFPTSGRGYVRRTLKETCNPECLVPTVKHGRASVIVLAAISWYSILLVPLLPFMAELLQGSTWTGWVIECIPLLPNNNSVFQDDNASIHMAGTVQSLFEEH
jgi:hypothetical protein